MKVGFAGSQRGMTQCQRETLVKVCKELQMTEAHHCDSEGSDIQAHHIFRRADRYLMIAAHPPATSHRAYCNADHFYPQAGYITSKKNMVDATDMLIACPYTTQENTKGVTWITVRYARLKAKNCLIILPNGLHILEINDGSK
jgi:hypothetical protein